jgi:ubiquinone/menaquinone biosynthesis C-methylase UbiE
MLARVLETEVMDTPEEARDYDAMDHSTVNRLFAGDLLTHWDGRGSILDVGTGTAQIPIEVCRLALAARVVGIDLADNMLTVGRANVTRAGLADQIELRLCDAKAMPFANASFQTVMSNSIVHHIPEPDRVLAEMVRVVAPGGVLFVRDLLRPTEERELLHLVHTYAGDANEHQRQMFADSLHAALTLAEIRALVGALGIDPSTVQQTSDRHWTWAARK